MINPHMSHRSHPSHALSRIVHGTTAAGEPRRARARLPLGHWSLVIHPPPRPHCRRTSAFTLIELTISAALMALILVSAYACLSSSISSRKLIDSRADAARSARVALSLLSADLR